MLLDGAMGNGFVERLLAASPSAVVLALPLQAAAQREIASCAPEIGEVRALYKALRGNSFIERIAREVAEWEIVT